MNPYLIIPLLVLVLIQTGCDGGDKVDEIEDTVVQLELENARLEEFRDDFNLENEELRRELEEKDGKNARIKLILSNARNLKDCGLIGNRGYNKQVITNQPFGGRNLNCVSKENE